AHRRCPPGHAARRPQTPTLFPYTTLFRSELLLHLEGQAFLGQRVTGVGEDERVVDLGHRVARKLDVDDRADALNDLTLCHVSLPDRKSTRLNSSHVKISYAVFCLKKKISH